MKYIMVDIDGTVADCEHRTHYVQSKPANWPAFNRAAKYDLPILPVIEAVEQFHKNGYSIVFCSGRSDDMEALTRQWIADNMKIDCYTLYMRKTGDYRADDIVKLELLERIRLDKLGWSPFCVFDDRPRVIRAWRSVGLFVFDVANGRWDGVEK